MSLGWIGAVVQGAKDFHDDVKDSTLTQWSWINNKKAATTAYRRQRALYMLDYNLHTPANQMRLLKEAHLNPNLVYGGGNPADVSAHAPNVDSASPMYVQNHASSGNPLSAYLDAKLAGEQIRNVEQQTAESKSRQALNESRQEKSDLEVRILRNTGVPANASASTRFYQKAKEWASNAKDAVVDYMRQSAERAKANSNEKYLNQKYKQFQRSRYFGVPFSSASDGSLYDYLYDMRSREMSTGRSHSDLDRYFPSPLNW